MHKAETHYALICQTNSIFAGEATRLYLQSNWKRANTWSHFRSCLKPRTNGFTFTWTKEKPSWAIRDFMCQPQASGCLSQSELLRKSTKSKKNFSSQPQVPLHIKSTWKIVSLLLNHSQIHDLSFNSSFFIFQIHKSRKLETQKYNKISKASIVVLTFL